MSMNLHVSATVKATLPNGKVIDITHNFELWQTPTKITRALLKADNVLNAYCEWILSVSEDKEEPIYDRKVDYFNPPIVGHKTVNYGKEHIEELMEWAQEYADDGFEIVFFEM